MTHKSIAAFKDPQQKSPRPTTKVLFAVFQTGNRSNGGVESISQVIDSPDMNCVVVTQLDTPTNVRWQKAGHEVKIFSLPYQIGEAFSTSSLLKKLKRLWSLVSTNLKTWRLIGQHEISVLHCNDPAPFWHVVLGAKIRGIPIVLNLRDTKSETEFTSVAKYRRKFRVSSTILVLSEEMSSFYQRLAGASFIKRHQIKFRHIYSIIDFDRMHPVSASLRNDLRGELGISEHVKSIGYVAVFNDKKNQLDFIRNALGELIQRDTDAHIYFIGDFTPDQNPYAAQCLTAAKECGIENHITFAGYTPEVEKWYQALDLVIVPTRKEGMARCMIEALACGTPVVSFDVCSAKEILTGHDCGIVVPQGDYPALVDAILRLANDLQQRHRLGTNGNLAARKLFKRDTVLEQYTELYRQASVEK